jgi:hypothetical protein
MQRFPKLGNNKESINDSIPQFSLTARDNPFRLEFQKEQLDVA